MKRDEILSYLNEFKNSSQNRIFTEIALFGSCGRLEVILKKINFIEEIIVDSGNGNH